MFATLRPFTIAVAPCALFCGDLQAEQQTELETVTVFAQKREADLQDVPMSVAALSALNLANAGLDDVAEVAQHEPTLDMQRSATATTTS